MLHFQDADGQWSIVGLEILENPTSRCSEASHVFVTELLRTFCWFVLQKQMIGNIQNLQNKRQIDQQ